MTSLRSMVTSSTSRRIIRFRSRCGVAGSRHRAGKSLASERILALCSSVRTVAAWAARSQSSWAPLELAQSVVPVGFEAVCDETVVGIDAEIAPSGNLGVVPGPFDVCMTEPVGFVDAVVDLGLDAERDFQGDGSELVEDDGGDCVVDPGARHPQAGRHTGADAGGHALVVGNLDVAPGVTAHGHATPAASTDGQALEQGGALSGGSGAAIGTPGLSVG